MIDKIFLVTKREYLTRVRKKSFIVMTILAPLLVALFYGVIIYLSINRSIGDSKKEIYVIDKTHQFISKLKGSDIISFTYGDEIKTSEQFKFLEENDYYAILNISAGVDSLKPQAQMVYNEQPGYTTVSYIEDQLNKVIREKELLKFGIDIESLNKINGHEITFKTVKATKDGLKSSNAGVTTAIGYIGAIAIYMFIFLYGVQVMQGVIEEKTNRIVEVIISSIKPFQLMMGKIIGIALVGLTQFVIWSILVTVLGGGISGFVMSEFGQHGTEMAANSSGGEIGDLLGALANFNYPFIISMFLFYFISGYLFYGALFAAIGSAVDNETDKQQFMLPVTMPLVFALVLSQSVIINNPNSNLSFWLSVIPFTSPIAMMVRIPFGVPIWQIGLSMCTMVLGFLGTVWLAGRIYRVGILMYGKKASYKELWKWLFYKA